MVVAGSKVQNFCHVATYVAELGVVSISSEPGEQSSWRFNERLLAMSCFPNNTSYALLASPNERAYAPKATPCTAHHRFAHHAT